MTHDPFWLHGKPEDFVDDAQRSAWRAARLALVPVDPNGIRVKHVPAPMLENIAKFLSRGDPIKPSLAAIIGRLLAGETFCALPQGLALPEQFDDAGHVIWNTGRPTRATIEAFTYRLVDGKVTRVKHGRADEPFRAGAIWRAAEAAREEIAKGVAKGTALQEAAKAYRVKVAEVRSQVERFEKGKT